MLIQRFYPLYGYTILIIFLLLKIASSTKCGNFICHANSECIFEGKKVYCKCEENFTKTIKDNNVYCEQRNEKSNVDDSEKECQEVGVKCDKDRICNEAFKCIDNRETKNVKELNCLSKEQECQDKCCAANEICGKENKCVAKQELEDTDPIECSPMQQCLSKCCAPQEVCYNNECVDKSLTEELEETYPNLSVLLCEPNELQCLNKCCTENEICNEDNLCVAKEGEQTSASQCPKPQQCLDKCCGVHEICSDTKECVVNNHNEIDANEVEIVCPDNGILCKDKCCKVTEICSALNECVAIATADCNEKQKCGNICCKTNEKCNDLKVCVEEQEKLPIELDCGELQQCQHKCCAVNEICSELHECIIKASKSFIDLYDFPSKEILNNDNNCLEDQQVCKNKCCTSLQTCNDKFECVNICLADHEICHQTCCKPDEICDHQLKKCLPKINDAGIPVNLDCDEKQKCDNICCKTHEVCSKSKVCVEEEVELPIIELNCGELQQCQHKCCAAQEICNELNECVLKVTPKHKLDSILPIYDFIDIPIKNDLNCLEDQQVCKNKCCNSQQTCNDKFECVNVVCLADHEMCHQTCCKLDEVCDHQLKKCLPITNYAVVDLFDFKNIATDCNEKQKCGNICCKSNEVCNNSEVCVKEEINCGKLQQCQHKCCAAHEICSELNKCVLKATNSIDKTPKYNFDSIIPLYDFHNIPNQKSEINCLEDQSVCKNKCCNSLQTCNDKYECVNVCLAEQQVCHETCCKLDEVCDHQLKKCLPKINDAIVDLYDFSNVERTEKVPCLENHIECLDICCGPTALCLENQCVCQDHSGAVYNKTLNSFYCVVEYAANNLDQTTPVMGYIMTGAGVLIAVFTFGLFKVYGFMCTKKYRF